MGRNFRYILCMRLFAQVMAQSKVIHGASLPTMLTAMVVSDSLTIAMMSVGGGEDTPSSFFQKKRKKCRASPPFIAYLIMRIFRTFPRGNRKTPKYDNFALLYNIVVPKHDMP